MVAINGNDVINAGNGDDTYIFNLGDGADTLTDADGADKIVFGVGISIDLLNVVQTPDGGLNIAINDTDSRGMVSIEWSLEEYSKQLVAFGEVLTKLKYLQPKYALS